jgi:hypothetical protein
VVDHSGIRSRWPYSSSCVLAAAPDLVPNGLRHSINELQASSSMEFSIQADAGGRAGAAPRALAPLLLGDDRAVVTFPSTLHITGI